MRPTSYMLRKFQVDPSLRPVIDTLKNKTYIVSGATRGLGFTIARTLAMNGANVTITGIPEKKDKELHNNIYTAAETITQDTQSHSCIGMECNLENEQHIEHVVNETVRIHGGLDGIILNTTSMILKNTQTINIDDIHKLSRVNINGTYILGKKCLTYMNKQRSGHVITISPPLGLFTKDKYWSSHFFYTMSMSNISLMAKHWSSEFKTIGVNTLWPSVVLNTPNHKCVYNSDELIFNSRHPSIMGDAVKSIVSSNPMECTGKNFLDEEVLTSLDVNIEQYNSCPARHTLSLKPSLFMD
jgi:citronellol/citronellal dehydrogenase